MKICNVCKAELPATSDHFNRRAASRDGLSYTCRSCTKAVRDRHYQEHSGAYKARAKEWATAHPDKRRQIVAKSAAKHADAHRSHQRQRAHLKYHRDIEQSRLIGRLNALRFRSRPENKAKVAEWDRRWRKNNPERMRANGVRNQQIRRARLRDALVDVVDRDVVFARDEGRCHLCMALVEYRDVHLDHVIPLYHGGKHSYANVRLSHSTCNLRKGTKLLTEVRAILEA